GFTNRRPRASTTSTPRIQATREVAEWAFRRSHKIMHRKIRLKVSSFRLALLFSDRRVCRKYQKKNNPKTRILQPSMFLSVATPVFIAVPVQASYFRPHPS